MRNQKVVPLLLLVILAVGSLAVMPSSAGASALPPCGPENDPDGDGYGWLGQWPDGESCRVVDGSPGGESETDPLDGACVDPDGDGWGWQGEWPEGRSCEVVNSGNTDGQPDSTPVDAPCVDPDGDGWGWQGDWPDGRSCQVPIAPDPIPSTCDGGDVDLDSSCTIGAIAEAGSAPTDVAEVDKISSPWNSLVFEHLGALRAAIERGDVPSDHLVFEVRYPLPPMGEGSPEYYSELLVMSPDAAARAGVVPGASVMVEKGDFATIGSGVGAFMGAMVGVAIATPGTPVAQGVAGAIGAGWGAWAGGRAGQSVDDLLGYLSSSEPSYQPYSSGFAGSAQEAANTYAGGNQLGEFAGLEGTDANDGGDDGGWGDMGGVTPW